MGIRRLSTASLDTTIADIKDAIVHINSDASGTNNVDLGFLLDRGSSGNVGIIWDESAESFALINTSSNAAVEGNLAITSYANLNINQLAIANGGITFPVADGNSGQLLSTDGNGTISWASAASVSLGDLGITATATELNYTDGVTSSIQTQIDAKGTLSNIVEDTTPQLGGDLDLNSNDITGTGNVNITGTGTFTTMTDGTVSFTSGNISGVDELRINENGTGLRMTNVGAFDNSSGNFRIFSTSGLVLSTDGDSNPRITIDNGGNVDLNSNDITGTGNINATGTITATGNITGGNLVTSGTVTLDRLSLSSSQTTVPPLQLTATSLNDGVGALRIDSVEPDIFLNDTDGGFATITFSAPDDGGIGRVAIGRDNNNDFYLTVRDPDTNGGNWRNDTFVADSSTGNVSFGYNLTVSGDATFTGIPTAPTANAGTNTTQIATTAFVSTAVSNLVDSAPGTLDTLNELAAALGDDANFSTTISTQIGNKLDSSSYTASDVLTKIKTVDGSGSGLDADTLDGVQGSSYLRSDANDTFSGSLTVTGSIIMDNGASDGAGIAFKSNGYTDWEIDSSGGSLRFFQPGTTYGTWTTSALTVSGNVVATEFQGVATSAQYADLAEKYMPDAEYEPGTVLMFGGEQEVTIANQHATRRLAGVVSTAPAYMMNSELDGGVYIALQGRVPCQVIGIAHKGDLLVTSATPGVAVAWADELRDPPAGSIIGKSLEEKALVGIDTIEVVVGVR